MVVGESHDGAVRSDLYTAEHLRRVREAYFDEGLRYHLVLGYDTYADPCGILERDVLIVGEGKGWAVMSEAP